MSTIPVCDLKAQIQSLEAELRAALDRVLTRGWFILGEEVRLFEEEFARSLGVAHVAGVASGTDAIHLALRALGLRPGDRVLTAPNSANPTACAISEAGAIPTFADVDLETGLLDPASVEAHLHSQVKAIVVVHLYGRCQPMNPILALAAKRGIPVIEDAAQAHGARDSGRMAGTMGAIGCFSFYPSKNLGAFGDAGAVGTSDPELDRRLRLLRNYGQESRYQHVTFGVNSRLDELQAAVLRVKLPHLATWNRRRRELAASYRAKLAGLPLRLPPAEPKGMEERTNYHLFVPQVAHRDRLRGELAARGIGTEIHYPIPIHLQPAYRFLQLGPGSYPRAERRAGRILSLPMYPELTEEQLDQVVLALRESLQGEPPPEDGEA